MMGISTHILDTSLGKPAVGVGVTLEVLDEGAWLALRTEKTDGDGRCKSMLPAGDLLSAGTYRLRFDTGDYYASQWMKGLYPLVEIVFEVKDAGEHFHIPLLLTPNGYTTYRGS